MLIVRAEVRDLGVRDLRVADGAVAEVAEGLRPLPHEDVIDAGGDAVLPGLHDHHRHVRAAAAALGSVDAAALTDDDALRRAIVHAASERSPGSWVRVVGYHESVAGELDRAVLDRLSPPATPVRVQHRSGALWVLNSAGCAALGLDGIQEAGVERERGRLWRRDDLLRRISELTPDALAAVGRLDVARGVTGFTDATPDGSTTDAQDLARDLRAAGVVQHLHLMGPVGALTPAAERASLGPVKVLLDDDRLPALDELAATVRAAHAEGRPLAVHCVTRVQLVLATTALAAAGPEPGDRIEHGSVVPPEVIGDLARLGVTVVSQPHFVVERGDAYRRDVDPDDLGSLYRLRSLADAGVALAAGTDAPFGGLDPWRSIAAAVDRRTTDGHALGAPEALGWEAAVDLYLGRPDAPGDPRRVEVGSPADLCVLAVPWHELPAVLGAPPVRATLVAGELAFVAD